MANPALSITDDDCGPSVSHGCLAPGERGCGAAPCRVTHTQAMLEGVSRVMGTAGGILGPDALMTQCKTSCIGLWGT
jgi:hypothetical protein